MAFDSKGQVAQMRDRFGNITHVTWDVPPPRGVKQIPPGGRFMRVEHTIDLRWHTLIVAFGAVFGPPLFLVILRVLRRL